MTWLNPVAFIGLLAVAVPILVHLFGRRVARRLRFPSLRLLQHIQPTLARRSRPSDVLLLVLRCAVVVMAAVALAQPLWSTRDREATAVVPVRAIVLDTSASMLRVATGGVAPVVAARNLARALFDSSRQAIVIETGDPGGVMSGAASWLAQRSGLRELVVLSDFQRGAVVDGHLAGVPEGIGVQLRRVPLVPARSDTTRYAVLPDRTEGSWPLSGPASLPLTILAGDDERRAVDAAVAAARVLVRPESIAHGRVAVVFPGAPGRQALASAVTALLEPWQGNLAIAMRSDPTLVQLSADAEPVPGCATAGAVIAENRRGDALAGMGALPASGEHDAVIFVCLSPADIAAAGVLASAAAALVPASPVAELEPLVLPDEQLRSWERPPTAFGPSDREDTSPDARWVWLVVVGMLLVEEVLRRRTSARASAVVTQSRDARAA